MNLRVHVIHHHHTRRRLGQTRRKRTSDEPGATGDEYRAQRSQTHEKKILVSLL